MDERDAFERQVAAEMARRAGPVQPVDDAAIYDAITSMPTPSRRFRWFGPTDARSVPAPATNGHKPTVRGRTQQMFSPAKAVAAAALLFAAGGLLAAQFRGPDMASAPASSASPETGLPDVSPAASQSEAPLDPMAANYWTGTYTGTGYELGVTGSSEGYFEEMGGSARGEVEADDPRMSGIMTQAYNTRSTIGREPERYVAIFSGSARIDNDAGAWVGTYTAWGGGWLGDEFYVLQGEGAYEGLTAVFQWHRADSSFHRMTARPGSRLPSRARDGIVRDLLIRQDAAPLGDNQPDIFGGNVLSQTEIAEKWRVSTSAVNKMAIDLERCQVAGIDPFDCS